MSWVQICQFCKEKSSKILPAIGILLMTSLSFLGGTFFQKDHATSQGKVIINIPDYEAKKESLKKEQSAISVTLPSTTVTTHVEPAVSQVPDANVEKDCPYVGSKNSTKYHLATCGVAKRIKLENRRCFASEAIAKASGYVAGCVK